MVELRNEVFTYNKEFLVVFVVILLIIVVYLLRYLIFLMSLFILLKY